jgi:hypothetical protein
MIRDRLPALRASPNDSQSLTDRVQTQSPHSILLFVPKSLEDIDSKGVQRLLRRAQIRTTNGLDGGADGSRTHDLRSANARGYFAGASG